MDNVKIGSFLKALRKEKGLTQEEVAVKFGVAGRTVSRWETGSNMPDISMLVELSEFYGIDVRELLDGERKSESVDKEIKETLEKVADYTDTEKEKVISAFKRVCLITVLLVVADNICLIANHGFENGYLTVFMVIIPLLILIILAAGLLYSYKIKSEMTKFRKFRKTLLIVGICVASTIVVYIAGFVAVYYIAFGSARIKVSDDISRYNDFMFDTTVEDYQHKMVEDESIFPEQITSDMNVTDYKMVYYNPFDPQYLSYLVVTYPNQESYEAEISRIEAKGIDEDYTDYYTVTGFSSYELVAMSAQDYGFIYALTDGDDTIIYVELEFCDWFYDLEYENYIPIEYLPDGFNAHHENPYMNERREAMGIT